MPRFRAALAVAGAVLLTVVSAPPAAAASWTQSGDSKTTRLDISDDGWIGYASIRAAKNSNGGWDVTATISKAAERSGCLRLKSDQGALIPGSAKLGEQCSQGAKQISATTGKKDSRLILEWTRSWKTNKTATIRL